MILAWASPFNAWYANQELSRQELDFLKLNLAFI